METAAIAPRRLGSLLVSHGYISPDNLLAALEKQKQEGREKLLGEIVVELQFCTEEQVAECLAEEYGVPYAQLDARLVDLKVIDVLPREYLERNLVVPLFLVRKALTIAVSEPSNLFLIDEIHGLANAQVQIVAATSRNIRQILATLPNARRASLYDAAESADAILAETEANIGGIAKHSESPTAQLVNQLITDAVRERASAIHIEPLEGCMRVRYRIDGLLHKATERPQHMLDAVIRHIKLMGGMDVAEQRLPQEGRADMAFENRKIDLRMSTFPGFRGEKIVIRIFDASAVSLNLADLGFAEDVLTALQRSLRAPNGIVLVTGPTGSGKTTTLYAALNAVNSVEHNVCTIEDPVEIQSPSINQFQVQAKAGMTFAKTLRMLLRQDPDIIMVGEMRDEETARATIQAALTGHLVFTSLHTNDACSAITRLVNMGIEPYLIGAAVNVVLSQRLVRRICSKCRTTYEPSRSIRKALERLGYDIPEFYHGIGCRACRNTGFKGRIGVHELLTIDDEMRDAIVANPTLANICKTAAASGMIPFSHDGLQKAREGITTVEEIFHIIGDVNEMGE
jgi:type IV pilus assembly protein PilB